MPRSGQASLKLALQYLESNIRNCILALMIQIPKLSPSLIWKGNFYTYMFDRTDADIFLLLSEYR